jgi:hypothetical protein
VGAVAEKKIFTSKEVSFLKRTSCFICDVLTELTKGLAPVLWAG